MDDEDGAMVHATRELRMIYTKLHTIFGSIDRATPTFEIPPSQNLDGYHSKKSLDTQRKKHRTATTITVRLHPYLNVSCRRYWLPAWDVILRNPASDVRPDGKPDHT